MTDLTVGKQKRRLQLRYKGIPQLGGIIRLVDKETQEDIEGFIPNSVEIMHTIDTGECVLANDAIHVVARFTIAITQEEDILMYPDEVEGEIIKRDGE